MSKRFWVVAVAALVVLALVSSIPLLTSPPTAAVRVAEAKGAFAAKNEKLAVALLSAALVADPGNQEALDLYRDHLRERFTAAVDARDWNRAQMQVAGYDSAVHAALRSATTRRSVEELLVREQEVTDWEVQLARQRDKFAVAEAGVIKQRLAQAKLEAARAMEGRLKQLPVEALGQEARDDVVATATALFQRRRELESAGLGEEVAAVHQESQKPALTANELRVLRVRAQQLHARLTESRLDGADVTLHQAKCEDLLSQLDQRLEVLSIRQMQQIADADANKAVEEAEGIFQKIKQEWDKVPYQRSGERLAEAEFALARIDRLCSLEIQVKARALLDKVRRDALGYRTGQQRRYNLWAIKMLGESVAEYDKNKGYLRDNRDELKKILTDRIGEIDPQHLHPAAHALFTEMFQKILSDLKREQKVEVSRDVEEKKKKPVSDF